MEEMANDPPALLVSYGGSLDPPGITSCSTIDKSIKTSFNQMTLRSFETVNPSEVDPKINVYACSSGRDHKNDTFFETADEPVALHQLRGGLSVEKAPTQRIEDGFTAITSPSCL